MAPRCAGTSLSQNHNSARIRRGVASKFLQCGLDIHVAPARPLLAGIVVRCRGRGPLVGGQAPPQMDRISAQQFFGYLLKVRMLDNFDVIRILVRCTAVVAQAVPTPPLLGPTAQW